MFQDIKKRRLAFQGLAQEEERVIVEEATEQRDLQNEAFDRRARVYEKHKKLIFSLLTALGEALFGEVPFRVEDHGYIPAQKPEEKPRAFRALLKVVRGSTRITEASYFNPIVYIEVNSEATGLIVFLEPRLAFGSSSPMIETGFTKEELVAAIEKLTLENRLTERSLSATATRNHGITARFL